MKLLRKFIGFILGVVLSIIIAAYLISYSISNIFQAELIRGAVQESLISSIVDTNTLSEEQHEQLNKILEDEEVTTIFNDMFGEIIGTLGTEDRVVNKDSINKMFDYFVDNKEKFESIIGEEIDVSELEKLKESSEFDEITDSFLETINDSRESLDETEKNAIKAYSFFTSQSFRNLMIVFGLFDLLLIALVQWSFYKWIRTLGNTLLSSGITLTVLYFVINVVIDNILYNLEMTMNVDLSKLLNMSIIIIVIGIILLIIYNVIKFIVKNKNTSNEKINNELNNEDILKNPNVNVTYDFEAINNNNEEKRD